MTTTAKIITLLVVLVICGFGIFVMRDAREGFRIMVEKGNRKLTGGKVLPAEVPQVFLKFSGEKEYIPVTLRKEFRKTGRPKYIIGAVDSDADIKIDLPIMQDMHAAIKRIDEMDESYWAFVNLGRVNPFKYFDTESEPGTWERLSYGEVVRLSDDIEGEQFKLGDDKNYIKFIIKAPNENCDVKTSDLEWSKKRKKAGPKVTVIHDEDEEYEEYEEYDDEDYVYKASTKGLFDDEDEIDI